MIIPIVFLDSDNTDHLNSDIDATRENIAFYDHCEINFNLTPNM